MLPQNLYIYIYIKDALKLILRELVASSKREVYRARISFIWVMKERGEAELPTPLLTLFNIELQRERNIFRWRRGGVIPETNEIVTHICSCITFFSFLL